MYLGIDLGTSNSAIAGFKNGRAGVFKTPENTDVMPSVIYRDRRGNQTIGVRAHDQAKLAPDNVIQRFKRLMGTLTPQRFAASGQSLTPEEASAEILRAMIGYALIEAGESSITGAVVTIPAAFNQMQCEATLSAAHAAGLERVALLQEPVAAAMAAMANARNRSGLFLVYDMGGGTFNVALVQALDGSVTVLAHEGINMLGGSDFDRLLVDNVIRPWLSRTFSLAQNFQVEPRYQRLVRFSRWAAEAAKIELSTRETTTINAGDEIIRIEDDRGESIYLDVPLDRRTLEQLVEERVSESIALCRKVLDDNGYTHEDVERVVLIGGPTKMPIVRHRVQDELGVAVEDISRVDPMTAVAIGAAIYCEGRDWDEAGSTGKATRKAIETAGPISVTYDYEARTAALRARLTVRRTSGPADSTVQIDSLLGWTSGRRRLSEPVVLDLDLPDPGPNRFRALVFDAAGRPVPEVCRELIIERLLATVAGVPATQTIGIKLLDDNERNTLGVLIPKGTVLPAQGVAPYRAAQTMRSGVGDTSSTIRIELFQISDERIEDPDLNLFVGEFRIESTDLPEGMSVRRGDEILVHWAMSEGQNISTEIEIPSVRQRFRSHNFYDYHPGQQSFDGVDGGNLVTTMLDQAEVDLERAESAVPSSEAVALVPIRKELATQRQTAESTLDPDTRRSIGEAARRIRQKVAVIGSRPSARAAILRRRVDEEIRWYDKGVRAGASNQENQHVDTIVRNARQAIEAGGPESLDIADRLIREINRYYWRFGLAQASFCVSLWRILRENRHLARDRVLFDRLLLQGDQALASGNTNDLRTAIFAVFDNQFTARTQTHVGERATLMRR